MRKMNREWCFGLLVLLYTYINSMISRDIPVKPMSLKPDGASL